MPKKIFVPRVESMALVIFSGPLGRRVYAVIELEEKLEIGKPKGSLSFPWETVNPGESREETLARLILEEVDCTMGISLTDPQFLGDFRVHDTMAHAYWCRLEGEPNPNGYRGQDEGSEVAAVGFIGPCELMESGREGVVPILRAAIELVVEAERAT